MAAADVITARQAEPIDLAVWRATGRGSGAVEAALEANPGLALTAEQLADGDQFTLPHASQGAREVQLIQLWD